MAEVRLSCVFVVHLLSRSTRALNQQTVLSAGYILLFRRITSCIIMFSFFFLILSSRSKSKSSKYFIEGNIKSKVSPKVFKNNQIPFGYHDLKCKFVTTTFFWIFLLFSDNHTERRYPLYSRGGLKNPKFSEPRKNLSNDCVNSKTPPQKSELD